MTKVLVQNIFYNHGGEYYLLACKYQGKIEVGDYLIINRNYKIKIEKIENGLFETFIVSVSRDSLEKMNGLLYNKEFFIEKTENTKP